MKTNQMVETENVKRALRYVKSLLDRPVTEMVGMMLIYGKPGLGKTRFGERLAYNNGFIYMRLEASMTNKDFLKKLLHHLYYRFHIEEGGTSRKNTNKLLDEVKAILNEYPNTVMVVDEIDYAFRNKKLLGTIRDIVDETTGVIILIGMQNARDELLKANEHFFDRCGYIMKFTNNSQKDIKKICNGISDVNIPDKAIERIYKNTKGNARKTIKLIKLAEDYNDTDKFMQILDILGDK